MRLTSVLATLAISAPAVLATLNIKIKAQDPTLSIFGVDGDREWLTFQSTKDRELLLIATSKDVMTYLPGLLPGNASFRHISDKMRVDCHVEGFPASANPDSGRPVSWTWTLASLADTSAKPCPTFDGMKLVCLDVIGVDSKEVEHDRKQLCL